MGSRRFNEEEYNKKHVEGDEIKNATICDEIADESLFWNPDEAIYWRKMAIEKAEKFYGNKSIRNTIFYDKIANDYFQKGSYSQAEKWNRKSKKIKTEEIGEYAKETLTNEIYEMKIAISMRKFGEIKNVWEYTKNSLQKNTDLSSSELYIIYLELIDIWTDYSIFAKKELDDMSYIIKISEQTIELAKEVYGEISMETAEAYRRKAMLFYKSEGTKEENRKSWDILMQAWRIATNSKDNKKDTLRLIRINMMNYEDYS